MPDDYKPPTPPRRWRDTCPPTPYRPGGATLGRNSGRFGVLLGGLLLLVGCAPLLEQDYGTVEPHANRYWEEDAGSDILRAESYQDLVNTLMLLVEEHRNSGTLRLYLTDVDYASALTMLKRAVTEVREETAIGSYALERLDFDMEELRNSYYQAELRPVYRRTAEDVAAIQETASSGAIYDMLLRAYEEGVSRLTVRYSYLSEEPEVLLANIRLLQGELEGFTRPADSGAEPTGEEGEPEEPANPEGPEAEGEAEPSPEDGGDGEPAPPPEETALWEVYFYPPKGQRSIIEVFLQPEGEAPSA